MERDLLDRMNPTWIRRRTRGWTVGYSFDEGPRWTRIFEPLVKPVNKILCFVFGHENDVAFALKEAGFTEEAECTSCCKVLG